MLDPDKSLIICTTESLCNLESWYTKKLKMDVLLDQS